MKAYKSKLTLNPAGRTAFLLTLACGGLALRAFGGADSQAEALLGKMTLDEKIGQMVQVDMAALQNQADIQKYFLGSLLSGGGSDPADNRAQTWLQVVNDYQAQALGTRLKIPLLYGIDAVHGHNNIDGAVIFPHDIGLGAAHDPELAARAARVTAEEVAGTGIHWAFGPCVAVAQDIRWGRTYESFSDDSTLVSTLGAAQVRGMQTPLANGFTVLACPKHYLADGGTQNGVDQGNTVCDEATLRKVFLPPYVAAVKAGAKSIMVSFSSWNGKKMHGNKYLLTDVLKGELGFKGFLVSDWAAIDQLSPDFKNDIEASINAGLDMVMIPAGPGQKNNYVEFISDLKELVAAGKVPQSRIDDAAKRILQAKLEIGLFEHPNADPKLLAEIGSAKHRAVARECVRQSLVLLKNEHQALPLAKDLKHLVVTGKAADDLGIQCGGWTISWQGAPGAVTQGGTTLLTAIKKTVSPETQVTFSPDGDDLQGAEAIVVVIGEMPYAEMKGDRSDLTLAPGDAALIKKAKATGVPVVTVLYSGRPLVLGSALDQSDALVAAWLPGTEGEGVADVLFGDFKPTGKLPRPWPHNNSELNSATFNNGDNQPLFASGFGLTWEAAAKPQKIKVAAARE
ncbi:MAG TPA: glycoside hydrolase family 3 N-terminal domain-containing protein [Verrucomicrobiae bacterium]|nr:glycoside hydrolase family 3 N-terminal domain-containing protein [Verrucomicrobiae bacterium]